LVHQAIGDRLYTIGVFAESGGTILIYDDTKDDIGYGRVHADRSALGRLLGDAGKSDYFMNLRPILGSPDADPLLLTKQPLWAESGMWPMQLARDFDGVVWIKTVHTPGMPLALIAVFALLHYSNDLEIAGVVLVLAAMTWLVLKIRRRRKSRASARPML
jgi:hypothetical protein